VHFEWRLANTHYLVNHGYVVKRLCDAGNLLIWLASLGVIRRRFRFDKLKCIDQTIGRHGLTLFALEARMLRTV